MRALRALFLLTLLALFPRAALAAETRPLVVGLTGKYPPFNYFDERGELTGFDVDVARALCRSLARPCEFRTLQWDGIVGALLAGRIDVVIGSMAITEERAEAVRFSRPYYESGAQLFLAPGADPAKPPARIGVTLGTTYEALVRARYPAAEVRVYKGEVDSIEDVAAGRLDALVTDRLVGRHIARARGVALQEVGAPLVEERMAIPVAPSETALLAELDRAVTELRASPEYDALMEKYFGTEAATPPAGGVTRAIAALLARGLGATLAVCAVGLGLGLVLAALAAVVLVRAGPAGRALGVAVDFVRATPFMVQLFVLYFGLPAVGVRLGAWASAVLAIAAHSAAYVSESLKTAYLAVPTEQRLAARALGLRPGETLRHVVWPQMLPVATVPVLNTVVAMIKDSAIVSVIGVYELTLQAQQLIAGTFRPMLFYALAAALYFTLTYPLLIAGRRLERRFRARGLLRG